MTGKILIYGAAGGIGEATARLLNEDGYCLHLVGRNEDKLSDLADELDADYTVGDVTDCDLFKQVASDVGDSLQGLVYAAGTINLGGLARLGEADFLNDFRVNAMGAALAVKSVLPALKKSSNPASVVLFSSVAALQGFTFHSSISMAKGAVNGLTLSLAAELAPKIRVNAIAPSLTDTPLAAGILSNEKIAAGIAGLHALPRVGSAEEVAKLATFLLSPNSDWITGQIISVDGGRSTLRTKG
ncbi:SDR family oxidoreductase [Rubellicoccus peritrichatus]